MTARTFPLALAVFVSFGAVVLALWAGVAPVDQAQMAARWTARVGFPIFILTYSASSLARLWPGETTKTVLRHRRQWGLGFAFAHTVHLAALVTYLRISGDSRTITTLIGGGGAYVMLYLMAFTSNDAAQRAMGVWWKRLHTLGIHWLWFIFTFSYFGRIFDPARMAQGLVFFPICIAALGLRIWAWSKARRKRLAI